MEPLSSNILVAARRDRPIKERTIMSWNPHGEIETKGRCPPASELLKSLELSVRREGDAYDRAYGRPDQQKPTSTSPK